MLKNKAYLILIVLTILTTCFFAITANAYFETWEVPAAPADAPIKNVVGLVQIVDSVLVVTYVTTLCLAILFIIFAAINYLGAAGDTEKVKTAHKQIVYALIAIAVTLISVGAVNLIKTFIQQ